jgi:hypothetical protein
VGIAEGGAVEGAVEGVFVVDGGALVIGDGVAAGVISSVGGAGALEDIIGALTGGVKKVGAAGVTRLRVVVVGRL